MFEEEGGVLYEAVYWLGRLWVRIKCWSVVVLAAGCSVGLDGRRFSASSLADGGFVGGMANEGAGIAATALVRRLGDRLGERAVAAVVGVTVAAETRNA